MFAHTLRTESDVEVLLHLYEELGIEFIHQIEGQFSFVVLDKIKNKIMFARDRWGITPLFYALPNNQLVVSSSIRSVISSGLIDDVSLDPTGLAESWALYGATSPRTCFKHIFQLPPGSFAEFDLTSHEFTNTSYMDMARPRRRSSESLTTLLEASVARRLQGDYAPGAYVSGGIDSSIIAALINQVSPTKPKLYSIAFENPAFDESPFQRMLADYLECELRTVTVGVDDIINNLDACVATTESPLTRSAPVPMMLLSAAVHADGLKYVLCGEGADELFAGYPVFTKGKASVTDKWNELSSFISYFQDPGLPDKLRASAMSFLEATTDLRTLRKREIDTKLSRYLLVGQGDRVSMANSVEQRFPFLDSGVSDLAFSASQEQLMCGGEGKRMLRESFRDLLPEQLLSRKKQGYLTPDFDVVTALQERGLLRQKLSKDMCDRVGVFRHDALDYLIQNFQTEAEARFLLFTYTTHVLFTDFMGDKTDDA